MIEKKVCPYVFILSLLVFNILNKADIQFCPYVFRSIDDTCSWFAVFFGLFLCPQAKKKGDRHSFDCLLSWRLW